jgi:hypothetical protein
VWKNNCAVITAGSRTIAAKALRIIVAEASCFAAALA